MDVEINKLLLEILIYKKEKSEFVLIQRYADAARLRDTERTLEKQLYEKLTGKEYKYDKKYECVDEIQKYTLLHFNVDYKSLNSGSEIDKVKALILALERNDKLGRLGL